MHTYIYICQDDNGTEPDKAFSRWTIKRNGKLVLLFILVLYDADKIDTRDFLSER